MNTLTFKTRVSDRHKHVRTILTSTFTKHKPKKIFYRCYKNFDNAEFEEELKKHLSKHLSKILNRFTLHFKRL